MPPVQPSSIHTDGPSLPCWACGGTHQRAAWAHSTSSLHWEFLLHIGGNGELSPGALFILLRLPSRFHTLAGHKAGEQWGVQAVVDLAAGAIMTERADI